MGCHLFMILSSREMEKRETHFTISLETTVSWRKNIDVNNIILSGLGFHASWLVEVNFY